MTSFSQTRSGACGTSAAIACSPTLSGSQADFPADCVCPVDCFYEGENMLVIHPDECIDFGVCEPECPVDAIKPDTEPGLEKWLGINAEYARVWPNITVKREPPPNPNEPQTTLTKPNL